MKEMILSTVREEMDNLIKIRRHIHTNPELSYQEDNTMEYICDKLDEHSIQYTKNVGGKGVVAIIGKEDGNCVALRGDIDALPIYEKTKADYASKNEGVMHACGHDVHTTCMIGAARALKTVEEKLDGCVKLIFQPAEEKIPGGAIEMIEAGVLSSHPKPQAIFALHVHPSLPVGELGFKSGMHMASADEVTVTIRGKGGHAAVPREFKDPIAAAASFIMQVQQVVSRQADPSIPTVISFGHIETKGGTFNVIPDEVVLKGTLRTMDESWRKQAAKSIELIAESVASGLGCSADTYVQYGYPCLINDPELTSWAKGQAAELHGEARIKHVPQRMTAEDFARYMQHIPGLFFRLGVSNHEKGITAPIHSPYFDVDEECMYYGASTMAWFAAQWLSNSNT